jgi:hypothetical protein
MNGAALLASLLGHPWFGALIKGAHWAADQGTRAKFEEEYRTRAQQHKGEGKRAFQARVDREIAAIKREIGWE